MFSMLYFIISSSNLGQPEVLKTIKQALRQTMPTFYNHRCALRLRPASQEPDNPDRVGFPFLRGSVLSRHNVYIPTFLCFLL